MVSALSCLILFSFNAWSVPQNSNGEYVLGWPFEEPESEWSRTYNSEGHIGDDAHAQDWNWGSRNEDRGKPVYSVSDGEVIYKFNKAPPCRKNTFCGFGNQVVVQINDSLAVRYAHLKSISVSKGQRVHAGETQIGEVGHSGLSGKCVNDGCYTAHLHIVLYKNIQDYASRGDNCYSSVINYRASYSLSNGKTPCRIRGAATQFAARFVLDPSTAGPGNTERAPRPEPQPPSPAPGSSSESALVMDISGSMGDRWKGGIKLESAKNAARRYIDLLEQEITATQSSHRVAIVGFSSTARTLVNLTRDYSRARSTVLSLGPQDDTNIGAGIKNALAELTTSSQNTEAKRFIILMSDGKHNTGMSRQEIFSGPVTTARQQNICIHTVGFGDRGDIDEELLKRIAQRSGCGEYSYASSGFDLKSVYIKFRHISLGEKVGEFPSGNVTKQILPGTTSTLGAIYIPSNKEQLIYTLTWPQGNRLRAQLLDPSGQKVDDDYPGANITYFSQLAHIVVGDPASGTWRVLATASDVPTGGSPYYAVLSARPGGLAIPFSLPTVCVEANGNRLCPAAPGILPTWLIITMTIAVLAVGLYLKFIQGGL